MARGRLLPSRPEQVQVLAEVLGEPDRLNQQLRSWAVTATCAARSQPVSLEEAQVAGLQAGRDRIRLYLYGAPELTLHHRLRVRGAEYRTVHLERWPSFQVAIAEHLEG